MAAFYAPTALGKGRTWLPLVWLCLVLHILSRGFVDIYLVTSHFPFCNLKSYWGWIGVPWRLMAFAGGLLSVAAVVLQVVFLASRSSGGGAVGGSDGGIPGAR